MVKKTDLQRIDEEAKYKQKKQREEIEKIKKREKAKVAISIQKKKVSKFLKKAKNHPTVKKAKILFKKNKRTKKVFYFNKSDGTQKYINTFLNNNRRTDKSFVSVRSRYYKSGQAKSIYKHISREVSESYDATKTQSVFPEYMENNLSHEFRSIEDCDQQYQETTGKKPRSDFRKAYEHVLSFSEDQFIELEAEYGEKVAKSALLEHLKLYTLKIQEEHGFEPVRIDLHLDEGSIDPSTGEFKRNIHSHIMFYNYDFENKFSPLSKLLKKVKDPVTNKLISNPAMSKFQDLAGDVFADLGFKRGVSKALTNKKHLSRDQFIAQKQSEQIEKIKNIDAQYDEKLSILESRFNEVEQRESKVNKKINTLKKAYTDLESDKVENKINKEATEHTLKLMSKLRMWKKFIINERFEDASRLKDDIEDVYDDVNQALNNRPNSKIISEIESTLDYEFKMAEEFEKQHYVYQQFRISPKLKNKR
tara:strand:+ start:2444 stop:3874 length:1431 start_codon:yes stop_codon:yes gene_type:complete